MMPPNLGPSKGKGNSTSPPRIFPTSERVTELDKGSSQEEPILIDSDTDDGNDTLPPIENILASVRSSQPSPSSSKTRRPSSSHSHGSPNKPASSPLTAKTPAKGKIKDKVYTVVDLTVSSDEDESTPRARRRTQRPSYTPINPISNHVKRSTTSPVKSITTPKQAQPGPGPSTSAFRKKTEFNHTQQSTMSAGSQPGGTRGNVKLEASPDRPLGTWGNPVSLGDRSQMDKVLASARERADAGDRGPNPPTVPGGSQVYTKQELVSPVNPGPPKGSWGNPASLDVPGEIEAILASKSAPSRGAKEEGSVPFRVMRPTERKTLSPNTEDTTKPAPSLPPNSPSGDVTSLDEPEPNRIGLSTGTPSRSFERLAAQATPVPHRGTWGDPLPLDQPQRMPGPPADMRQCTPSAPSTAETPNPSSKVTSPIVPEAVHQACNSSRDAEPLFLPNTTPPGRDSSLRLTDSSDPIDESAPHFEQLSSDIVDRSTLAPPLSHEKPQIPEPGTWGNFIQFDPTTMRSRTKRPPSAEVEGQATPKKSRKHTETSTASASTRIPVSVADPSEPPAEQIDNLAAATPVPVPTASRPARRAPTWVTQSRAPSPKPAVLSESAHTPAPEMPHVVDSGPPVEPDTPMDVHEPMTCNLPRMVIDKGAQVDASFQPREGAVIDIAIQQLDPPQVMLESQAPQMKPADADSHNLDVVPPSPVNEDQIASETSDVDAVVSGHMPDAGVVVPTEISCMSVDSERHDKQRTEFDPNTLDHANGTGIIETSKVTDPSLKEALESELLTKAEPVQSSNGPEETVSDSILTATARVSPAPSSAPSIQELSADEFRTPTLPERSPLPDTPISSRPPNMSALEYLRMRVRNRNQRRTSSTPGPSTLHEVQPVLASVPPSPDLSGAGPLAPHSENSMDTSDVSSRAAWRKIVEEDGASDVEILLDGDSGPSSDRSPYDDMVDNQLYHGPRLHDPTQSPPPDRRGVAKRQFDSRDIDEWNDRVPYLTKNRALHRVIFESYIQQKELESGSIGVINNVDSEGAPPDMEFEYSNEMLYNLDVPDPEKGLGCGCDGPCDPNSRTCTCVRRQKLYFYGMEDLRGFAYRKDGTAKNLSIPIWECGETCGCPPECMNRVIQRGRSPATKLELVKTRLKGWGVQAKEKIPMGTFIGIYAGEVITEEESELRGELYSEIGRTYLFDLDGWQIANPPAGLAAIDPRLAEIAEASAERAKSMMETADPTVVYNAYSVDAFHYGYTRFFNHSCDPNLEITQCYVKDFHPERPLLVIFARRDIAAREELCISYKGINDEEEISEPVIERKTGKKGKKRQSKTSVAAHISAKDKKANAKMQRNICYCKAPNCDGQMFRL